MLNTFEQPRSQDERRQQRERHIAIMDSIGKSIESGEDAAFPISGSGTSTATGLSDFGSSVVPPGGDDPPRGAIEKAKLFLWEEDEEYGDDTSVPKSKKNELPAMKSSWNNPMFADKEKKDKQFSFSGLFNLQTEPSIRPNQRERKGTIDHIQSMMRRKTENEAPALNLAPRRQSKDSLHFDDLELDDMSLDSSTDKSFTRLQLCKISLAECGQGIYKRRKPLAIMTVLACIIGTCTAVFLPQFINRNEPLPETVSNPSRYTDIKAKILKSGVSSEAEVDRKGTPQHEALIWIADEDGAKLDVDDEMLVQRYSLAVFFFSTYVEAEEQEEVEWKQSDSSSSIAMAKSADTSTDTDVEPKGWKNSTNWMTKKGFCSWAGVGCHHKPGTSTEKIHYDGNYGVTHLNLTKNNVRGKVPNEITAFTDLRLLHLGDNMMSGTIPSGIGDLEHLVTLHMGSNKFSGSIPESLGKLKVMTHLYLYGNELGGEIPVKLSEAEKLRALSLYNNKLDGNIPDLRNLTHLADLYLDDNRLKGTIPPEISHLTVRDLRLSQNNLKGTIPEEIGDMENLESLYIDRNALTGSIPSSLSQLDHLEKFHAYGNKLKGKLPYQLGSLENLQILYLDNNELEGTIPHSWGGSKTRVGLQDLQQLFLHNNKLTGKIPTELGAMEDMRNLQLNDNQFSGTIPSELGKMFKLQYIYMENNHLTGEIPDELSKLEKLERLRINGNEISGEVSDEVCSLSKDEGGKLAEFHLDCDGETPEVECDCCTSCF